MRDGIKLLLVYNAHIIIDKENSFVETKIETIENNDIIYI